MSERGGSKPPPDGMAGEFSPSASSVHVLGMAIFLISLTILFAATMAGYIIVRLRAAQWPPPGTPSLPWGLWISTAILIGCSAAIHRALLKARQGDQRTLRHSLVAAFACGAGFLAAQTINWISLVAVELTIKSSLYAFTFYTLTGLHAAHVIGGLVQLGIVTRRAFEGRYGPGAHIGVTLSAMYWHFLDAMWLVLFLCLMALS